MQATNNPIPAALRAVHLRLLRAVVLRVALRAEVVRFWQLWPTVNEVRKLVRPAPATKQAA